MKDSTPTLDEKVEMYERFLHKINAGFTCTDNEMIRELVENADRWSYMHRISNGELSDEEQDKLINKAFWKLCDTPSSDAKREEMRKAYVKAQQYTNN